MRAARTARETWHRGGGLGAGRRCCCAVAGSFIFVLITPRLQYRQFCSTTVTDCATLCARARMRAAAIEICAI